MSLAVSVTGCAPDDFVFVPSPPRDQGALILGLQRADHNPSLVVRAFDLPAREELLRLPEEIDSDEEVLLEALLYSSPLASSSLEEGRLEPVEAGEPERGLPSSDEIYRVELPNETPRWERIGAPSATLAGFRIPDPGLKRCARFTTSPFSLGDPTNTELALTVSSTVVLIGMRSGRLQRWTPSGLEPIEVTPSVVLSHGAWDPAEGVWWFMSRNGQLFEGTFPSSSVLELTYVTQSIPPFDQRYRIALRREGGEPRVYSIRSDGLFQRYETSGVTDLYAFGDGDFGNNTFLTPDLDVLAAASGSTDVVRVTPEGEVRVEAVPAAAGFTAAAYVEDLGVVLGSSDGRFFVNRGDGWTELGDSPLNVFPFAIAPYRGGFLYGAAFGAGGQYLPEGYCMVVESLAAYTIQLIVPIRGGFLMLGQNPNVPETPGELVQLMEDG